MSALPGSEPAEAGAEAGKPDASPETAQASAGIVILDASVLIGHFDNNDLHHASAVSLLAATRGQMLGASAITLAETLVAPARAGRLADAQAALGRLGVKELALGDEASWRLAQLRADLGVKLPECCVLLAAQEHAGAVASFDTGVIKAARKLGLRTVE
ncbi:MAG: type II toxin-antitoxin system VapC family toxin [Solirubrobacteraceae bacterium]